jgi:hypothetical protein
MNISCKGWERPNGEKDIYISTLELPQFPIKQLLVKRKEKKKPQAHPSLTNRSMNKCLQLLPNMVSHCINIFIFLLVNYGWLSFE